MPQPRRLGFIMMTKVDADHAADTVTRRSRTGFLVCLNSAPIHWLSKKQIGCESSSFGSEFTVMKNCCECLRGPRCKLMMMGTPVNGPAHIHGDVQLLSCDAMTPDSILKKKSQNIARHFGREGVVCDEWRMVHINVHENPADLLTTPLPAGEKRRNFVRMISHHVFGSVQGVSGTKALLSRRP